MVIQLNETILSKLLGASAAGENSEQRAIQEHLHVRSHGKAGLFDMSFLVQMRWHGKDVVEFLEKILVGDIYSLEAGKGILSVITNSNGGIIDDTIVTNVGDHFVMTIHDKYQDHFETEIASFDGEVFMEYFQHSILALQGPGAPSVMSKLLPSDFDLQRMAFMTSRDTILLNQEACRIARCGFTGEDGFELHIPSETGAFSIASKLLADPNVMPASLLALNTLRLEAGLCSKGKELHEAVNPVEASLGWTIAPRRRSSGDFSGAASLVTSEGKLKKATRKCVGILGLTFVPDERTEVFDSDGTVKVGEITSAAFSPCMEKPIAMALVDSMNAKRGTELVLKTTIGEEEKSDKVQVVKLPFVETRFYKVPEDTKEKVHDPSTGEVFDSPRSVSNVFAGGSPQSKVSLPPLGNSPSRKIRDPATGEVFECGLLPLEI